MTSYISDVQPRVMMCPLPEGYEWLVEFLTRLGSVHIRIVKRGRFGGSRELDSSCACLDYALKSDDEVVRQVINNSFKTWNEYMAKKTDGESKELRDRIVRINDKLQAGTTPVTVRIRS